MDNSEVQFNTLLGQLVARANRVLKSGGIFPPLAVGLKSNGECLVFTAEFQSTDEMENVLTAIRNEISARAHSGEIVASCVSIMNTELGCVIANLENCENICARVFIPVGTVPRLHLKLRKLVVEDGEVYVFPAVPAN